MLNAAPLLVLAALYLGVAAALAPALWQERRRSPWLGLAVWLVFVVVGLLASVLGASKLDDAEPLGVGGGVAVFALAIAGLAPPLLVLARWRERGVLVAAGSRILAAEERAAETGRDAASISRLSAALSRGVTAEEAAERLFDELEGLDGVEAMLLGVVDEEEGRVVGLTSRGVDLGWWRGAVIDANEEAGGFATVARDRTAYAVHDVDSVATVAGPLAAVGAKSAAFVPLIAEGRVTGVVAAATLSRRRFFSPSELELMQQLANETALALDTTRSADALRAALERERLVTAIARKVRSEFDLDDVLQVAVSETGRALGVARSFIRLGTPGGPMPVEAEWVAPGTEPVGAAAELLAVSNLAISEGRTVAVADVATAPELEDRSLGGREALLALGARAVLATPILVFDRVIGVFALHRTEPGPWSPTEVSLAEAVAGEAGLAIHTARLLDEDERRLGQQGALLKAAQVVTSDVRFESVLRRLV